MNTRVGIDVHKRPLAVVVADVAVDGEFHFERRTVGTSPDQLRGLAEWLVAQDIYHALPTAVTKRLGNR
jgi:hypothetical protein